MPGDDIRGIDWNAYARLDRLYIKEYMEVLSDDYDEKLEEIPPTLKYDYEDTDFVCPTCGGKLQRKYFLDPHEQKIYVEEGMLYCPTDDETFYEQNLIWKANNSGGGSGGGSKVRMVGNVLTITDA